MNRTQLAITLKKLDDKGIYVFSFQDLKRWFPSEPLTSFKTALRRHVNAGLLENPCRSIYLNPNSQHISGYILEHIAINLHKGEYNYLSLESLLSEIGVISQVPIGLITIMTTGRSQNFETPYGKIEFTHTKRSISNILQNTYKIPERPLRLATKKTAIRDLKRVNRNLHMIDMEQDDD